MFFSAQTKASSLEWPVNPGLVFPLGMSVKFCAEMLSNILLAVQLQIQRNFSSDTNYRSYGMRLMHYSERMG
ncbi:hypothetical protein C7N83_07405 [Neisseria iguanae]|uniref:Uncharacterized protein n=2 Tax=Neisseria iguanae TaxID=90242 RepID=A0A2P7TZS4_9NEIS|nr:hypothetical protein C7N83_07405 [Neisseria iguanae]